ncbi:MAG: hypothetical protein CSA82_00575 [Actinobacteria bacterium]|nr:MAG: hypothetical protein CSA82_00575 [Actinomycetota bacterium]
MAVEAGWYTDPADSQRLRWWNGQSWAAESFSPTEVSGQKVPKAPFSSPAAPAVAEGDSMKSEEPLPSVSSSVSQPTQQLEPPYAATYATSKPSEIPLPGAHSSAAMPYASTAMSSGPIGATSARTEKSPRQRASLLPLLLVSALALILLFVVIIEGVILVQQKGELRDLREENGQLSSEVSRLQEIEKQRQIEEQEISQDAARWCDNVTEDKRTQLIDFHAELFSAKKAVQKAVLKKCPEKVAIVEASGSVLTTFEEAFTIGDCTSRLPGLTDINGTFQYQGVGDIAHPVDGVRNGDLWFSVNLVSADGTNLAETEVSLKNLEPGNTYDWSTTIAYDDIDRIDTCVVSFDSWWATGY